MEIKDRLDVICNNRQIDGSETKVTISKDDFLWLVYGVQEQTEKCERYEKIIHNIANIDTMFLNPDGTEREWNDKEALKEIESMVKPIWDEHCEKSWEKHRKASRKK